MNNYKVVDEFKSKNPDRFDSIKSKSEMIESEIGFLCGLIRDNKPKKIVEVGVAAGGTTAAILECLSELNYKNKMYSVDLSETYYRDIHKPSGFIAEEYKQKINYMGEHKFLLGKVLPERLDEIGKGIDFLILDTMHILPGEVLDFLAAFPYLSENAIVVLHDTFYHYRHHTYAGYATSILFQTVTADKYFNNQKEYPNIAAFKVNQDTGKYILDVVNSLIITWAYIPDDQMLDVYKKTYSENYDSSVINMFEQTVTAAKKYMIDEAEIKNSIIGIIIDFVKLIDPVKNNQIYLYGAGEYGASMHKMLKELNVEVSGFVVSDGQAKCDCYCGLPVLYLSEIANTNSDCAIIKAAANNAIDNIINSSGYNGIVLPNKILGYINDYYKAVKNNFLFSRLGENNDI